MEGSKGEGFPHGWNSVPPRRCPTSDVEARWAEDPSRLQLQMHVDKESWRCGCCEKGLPCRARKRVCGGSCGPVLNLKLRKDLSPGLGLHGRIGTDCT